jgi:3-dehydroquinate dehydratase / shikimate dehydrogenase
MTRLCIPIFVTSDIAALEQTALSAAEAGADILELRLDEFANDDVTRTALLGFLRTSPLPCLLTCRPIWEGGRSKLEDIERFELLNALSSHRAEYVDFELAATPSVYLSQRLLPLILSSHDFDGRPDRLTNLVLEMNASTSTINKIVWQARTIRDNIEAFELLSMKQKPTIALCMGEAGLISRVLAKKFGAFLSFASLDRGQESAPGQIRIADMKRLYRWDAIGTKTKVFGVVGSPVAHSMSPAIHNAAFEEVGYDGVYLPLLVNESYESFKAFMESFLAFKPLDLSGLSVTIPHKENALRFLKERGADVEELAQRIGAVNTIQIDSNGALRGRNTDYAAILDSITAGLKIAREDLSKYRVAVIGAGGTGRTAVAALAHYGATVVIYNRTRERSEALAAEFNGRSGKVVAAEMSKLCDSCCQIYINTTSVGMHPQINASPLGTKLPKFSSDTLAFDTVYNPPRTKFLQQAEEAGAKTIGGLEMFVRQAAAQFQLWTGQPAPLKIMRKVIKERLLTS